MPVLVAASKHEAEGAYVETLGKPSQLVRRLTWKDLPGRVADLKKWAVESGYFTPEEWNLLTGLSSLKVALPKYDKLAIENALQLVFRHSGAKGNPADNAAFVMSHPIEAVKLFATGFIGRVLGQARLVYWFHVSDSEIGPGIFCPDIRTAIVVKFILGSSFRVCPHCHTTFLAERKTQMCCTVECREAHRIARWRARQKTGEKP